MPCASPGAIIIIKYDGFITKYHSVAAVPHQKLQVIDESGIKQDQHNQQQHNKNSAKQPITASLVGTQCFDARV